MATAIRSLEQIYAVMGSIVNIKVLSVAGFDPSAGAGVLADIKTFQTFDCHGLAVITCQTIQHEGDFKGLLEVDEKIIESQIRLLFDRYDIQVVKVGMVVSFDQLKRIIDLIRSLNKEVRFVWDPILETSTGFKVHSPLEIKKCFDLFGAKDLITPNKFEMESVFGSVDKGVSNTNF